MPPKAKEGARKRNSSRDRRGAAKAAAAAATVASARRKSAPPAETGGSEPAASKEESKESKDEVVEEVKEKAPPVVKMEKEQIKMVFTRFDLNGNGTIEVDELATVFQVLAPRQWSQKAIKRLFDGMDLDEDGKICFSEFIEWIFDSGTNSFKGALEIAETTDGAKTLERSVADCSEPIVLPNLRSELAVIEGCNMEEEIKEIQPDDLQKLETLMVVPDPIRRTLEAVYMLLLPSSGLPSINALTPPEWAGIQEMLKDSSMLQRVLNYTARKEEMVTRPLWGSYAARRFFSIEKVDADLKELDEPARPLSYERVLSSCESLFGTADGKKHAVVLLYKWVLSLLMPDLKELADRFGQ